MALSRITRGSIEDRLSWMFSIYDRNADGYITFNEILEVDKAVHAMVGKHSQPIEPGLTIASHASEAFEVFVIYFYRTTYFSTILIEIFFKCNNN